MAPIASTSKLPPSNKKRFTKKSEQSLLSNSRELPTQSDYAPATQSLKKYIYSSSALSELNYSKNKNLGNLKLGLELNAIKATAKASAVQAYEHDDLLLSHGNAGLIETETEMERTWKITQKEILQGSGIAAESKAFSLKLEEFGPYEVDYTRNGRWVIGILQLKIADFWIGI